MRIVLSNATVKWGGVHVFTELLARGLLARGQHVKVFGAPGSILSERMKSVAQFEPVLHGMDLNPVSLWRVQSALARCLSEVVLALLKKDVRLYVPAACARRIPSVVRHANDRPLTGWIYDQLFFGALPALHITNSRATRATLLKARWLQPEAVKVIYNGIDPSPIDSAIPARLEMPEDAVVIGFAGRLERRKGLLDLMRAWPTVAGEVPNAHLVIAGKGPGEPEARQTLGDAPRVHWLGYRDDIPSVLRAIHIAVVPSHWEGFGFIAAEAMAAGLPVVAADASSLPEIISDGIEGMLFPAHDVVALARALVRLSRDAGLRARMGAAGRARVVGQFGVERMVDEYEQVLESVSR
jgi:glycosyltransferase involved in cell wall biosynthesis